MGNKLIKKIIKFTEDITKGNELNRSEALRMLKIIDKLNLNLNIYKGIIVLHYFAKFKEFPSKSFERLNKNENFLKCLSFLKGDILSPFEIGNAFLDMLTLPDDSAEFRDILMGCFYGALWPFMNDPKNLETAVDYGLAIIKSAFSLDNFDVHKKIKLGKTVKVVNLAGSGKKEIKLLNISSMSAVITAAVSKAIGENIVVAKTISRATSSVTGSGDIFEILGVNLNLPIERMADIMRKTKLGVFDINKIVPRLNRVYDGRLYNVQVFAGLVGGAAIVNPIDSDFINYGLTRGSTKLCLTILKKLYPEKNILIVQGKNKYGNTAIDQISIEGKTEIAQNAKGRAIIYEITPKDFGFNFGSLRHLKTSPTKKGNLYKFIKLLKGYGTEELKKTVAMEVSLNLWGLGLVNNLKIGAELALETINCGKGIEILEEMVEYSGSNKQKLRGLIKS